MTVTFTADEQDVYPPRVLLTAAGLTLGDSVDIYRSVGGERTAVRAGSSDAVTDTSFLTVDAELPFGTPVTYVLVVNDATEYTAGPTTYELPGGKVAVTDAITGQAAEVVILAWAEKAYGRQSSVFQVGGRNVVVAGPVVGFESTIELVTQSTSARDSLVDVLRDATEGIVQIRQPGGYDGVDSYVAVTSFTERRHSQDGSDPRRIIAVQAVEVDPWAAELEATGYTLQDIADAYTGLTLDDLEDDYATLLELAQGEFGV